MIESRIGSLVDGVDLSQDHSQIAARHPINYPLPELKSDVTGHEIGAFKAIDATSGEQC
jgi:hypothetical protein